MAIKNIGNNISKEDMATIRSKRNKPDYEDGYAPKTTSTKIDFGEDGLQGMEDKFSSLEDLFSTKYMGEPSKDGQDTLSSLMGNSNNIAQPGSLFNMTSMNNMNTMNNQQTQTKSTMDEIIEGSTKVVGEAMKTTGKNIPAIFKNIRSMRADDYGDMGATLLKIALAIAGVSTALCILSLMGKIDFLMKIGLHGVATGVATVGLSVIQLYVAAYVIDKQKKKGTYESNNKSYYDTKDNFSSYDGSGISYIDDIMGIDDSEEDEEEEEEEVNNSSGIVPIMEEGYDIFGNPLTKDIPPLNKQEKKKLSLEDVIANFSSTNNTQTPSNILDSVRSDVKIRDRKFLLDTFKPFFAKVSPDFAKVRIIDQGTEEFDTLEVACLKALAAAKGVKLENLEDSFLESAKETWLTIEMRVKRITGLNKLPDIAREIVAYFREDSEDSGVDATVELEGDYYKIEVIKGETALVTLGDILIKEEVTEEFLDKKINLPIVVGISQSGKAIIKDAKLFDSMIVVGQPRSGKSWYVLLLIMVLAIFNNTEDVQFVIIDPKKTTLFRTVSYLPHVAGLHSSQNILQILADIIAVEGERRIALLSANKCDSIWDLRNRKNIKVPILYIVIDEVVSITHELSADKDSVKQFKEYIGTIATKLPYVGIRLLIVPHRAVSVIDVNSRNNMSFSAAVKASTDVVKETLMLKKAFHRNLTKVGDIALNMAGEDKPIYVRGIGLSSSDEDNVTLIENIAKGFYKIGFEPTQGEYLKSAYNRDEEEIRQELGLEKDKGWVQYDVSNIDTLEV